MKEITKVYTKYDSVPNRIIESYIKPLTIGLFADIPIGHREYKLHDIEEGLEGVRFVHYRCENTP